MKSIYSNLLEEKNVIFPIESNISRIALIIQIYFKDKNKISDGRIYFVNKNGKVQFFMTIVKMLEFNNEYLITERKDNRIIITVKNSAGIKTDFTLHIETDNIMKQINIYDVYDCF